MKYYKHVRTYLKQTIFVVIGILISFLFRVFGFYSVDEFECVLLLFAITFVLVNMVFIWRIR